MSDKDRHRQRLLEARYSNNPSWNDRKLGPPKIFLSHPHSEGKVAAAFADWLEYRVFGGGGPKVVCTSRGRILGPLTPTLIKELQSSSIVICLLSPETPTAWVSYEMGAAQALESEFIPCTMRGLSLSNLPPQAGEYRGADLTDERELEDLVVHLSDQLKIHIMTFGNIEDIAKSFR